MDVTRNITYTGPAAWAGALVQTLEDEGVGVEWLPPQEQRGLGADVAAVVLSMLASGGYDAIKAGVVHFRERFPRAKVEVEGEPDDGGFLDDPAQPES